METGKQKVRKLLQVGQHVLDLIRSVLSWVLVGLIRIYKLAISPMLGPHCRFEPSCSSYAIEAIQERGVIVGALLSINRIRRCHPWSDGGYDPVPKKSQNNQR